MHFIIKNAFSSLTNRKNHFGIFERHLSQKRKLGVANQLGHHPLQVFVPGVKAKLKGLFGPLVAYLPFHATAGGSVHVMQKIEDGLKRRSLSVPNFHP